jgi:transposase
MNTDTKFFMGIDVSKPHFDVSLMAVVNHQKQSMETARFDNTDAGMKAFEKWMKTNKATMDQNMLLVIENTGIYHRIIWSFCTNKNLPIHIGNAAHIKWSFGIARGKNDQIDSQRLCQYAQKHADEIKATPALDPVLMQLKDLITSRVHLLTQLTSNKTYLKELKNVSDPLIQKQLQGAYKAAIEGIATSIANLEALIVKIIAGNAAFAVNYALLLSVPGIGHITAVYLIGCTNNFAGRISGKQLACYAGVVPFEEKSGISIKGKSKVHPMANKDLKKLLHLCAMSAIQHCEELKDYYKRKKAEGKHRMSILNAVRNKIALRAAAVVNNQKKYVDKTKMAA